MTLAWYDPTNQHVSTDKNDPLFTPLGQLWPLEVKREWVGLTKEELCEIVGLSTNDSDWNVFKVQEWLRKVEARLKEKNT